MLSAPYAPVYTQMIHSLATDDKAVAYLQPPVPTQMIHGRRATFIYTIDRSFLLIVAGDVELNPGPGDDTKCPCEKDKRDPTIKYSKCKQCWHISCVGLKGITDAALEKLKSWNCVICLELRARIKAKLALDLNENKMDRLDNILEKLNDMETNINKKINDKIVVPDPMAYNGNENNATEAPYRAVAIKKLERKQAETNNLVRNLIRKNDENRPVNEEELNRKKKTRIVRMPKDVNIKHSKDIRKHFDTLS